MLEDSGTQDSCPHTSSLLLPGLLWTRGIVTPGGWPNGRTFPSHMSFSSVFWRVLETGRLSPPKTAYPGVHNVAPPLAFSGRAPHLGIGRNVAPRSPLGALTDEAAASTECPGHCSQRCSPSPAFPLVSSPCCPATPRPAAPRAESLCSSTLTPPRQAWRFLPSHLLRRRQASNHLSGLRAVHRRITVLWFFWLKTISFYPHLVGSILPYLWNC